MGRAPYIAILSLPMNRVRFLLTFGTVKVIKRRFLVPGVSRLLRPGSLLTKFVILFAVWFVHARGAEYNDGGGKLDTCVAVAETGRNATSIYSLFVFVPSYSDVNLSISFLLPRRGCQTRPEWPMQCSKNLVLCLVMLARVLLSRDAWSSQTLKFLGTHVA